MVQEQEWAHSPRGFFTLGPGLRISLCLSPPGGHCEELKPAFAP